MTISWNECEEDQRDCLCIPLEFSTKSRKYLSRHWGGNRLYFYIPGHHVFLGNFPGILSWRRINSTSSFSGTWSLSLSPSDFFSSLVLSFSCHCFYNGSLAKDKSNLCHTGSIIGKSLGQPICSSDSVYQADTSPVSEILGEDSQVLSGEFVQLPSGRHCVYLPGTNRLRLSFVVTTVRLVKCHCLQMNTAVWTMNVWQT